MQTLEHKTYLDILKIKKTNEGKSAPAHALDTTVPQLNVSSCRYLLAYRTEIHRLKAICRPTTVATKVTWGPWTAQ